MLETPSYPAISRVIRIRPGPDEKPVEGFSWGDYEDVNESDLKDSWQESAEGSADDGWGVVKSRSRTSSFQFQIIQNNILLNSRFLLYRIRSQCALVISYSTTFNCT